MTRAEYLALLRKYESLQEITNTIPSTLSERARTELDTMSKEWDEQLTTYETTHRIKKREHSTTYNKMVVTHSKGYYIFFTIITLILTLGILYVGLNISAFTAALMEPAYYDTGIDYDDYLSQLDDLYGSSEAE